MTSAPGLDLARLTAWARDHEVAVGRGSLTVQRLAGGRSNLTYLVSGPSGRFVVRRPPVGPVPASAHDMGREFRVLSALRDSAVPVPHVMAECADVEVLGAPFYLMEYVEGRVLRTRGDVAAYDSSAKADLTGRLVETLVTINTVDVAAVGLGDLGRADGYLERQVARWRKHLEIWGSPVADRLSAVADELAASMPGESRKALVHGDFRLDNVIVGDDLTVRAVVDWEMATLGDPLADLGLTLVYWDVVAELGDAVASAMGPSAGFPPGEEVVRSYAGRTGWDLSGIDWYVALAAFKLAVVLEGVRFRDERSSSGPPVADVVPVLVSHAERLL